MNAPFGRTRVTRGWNRDVVLYDRGWNRDLVLYDHTFSNLSGMERECARTVRSSSKASNPTFQPLIGSQEPTPEVLVPVMNLIDADSEPGPRIQDPDRSAAKNKKIDNVFWEEEPKDTIVGCGEKTLSCGVCVRLGVCVCPCRMIY